MFILAYIKVKTPDTSSNIVIPPVITSTPINWTLNKWNYPQFQISPGKLLIRINCKILINCCLKKF